MRLLPTADVLIAVLPDGTRTWVSPSVQQALGFAPESLVGPTALAAIHSLDEAVDEHRRGLAHGGGELRRTLRLVAADGSSRWFDAAISAVTADDGTVLGSVCSLRSVDELIDVRDALLASREKYRAVASALHEGIVLHATDGRILEANDRAMEILGLTADQLDGRTPMDARWRTVHVDGSPFPGNTHPASVALATGESQRDIVMGVYQADGSLTWILVNAEPLPSTGGHPDAAAVVSFTDITTLREREVDLAASQEQYRLLAENASDVVYRTSARGECLWVSPSVRTTLGWEPAQVLGRTMTEFIHPADLEGAERLRDQAVESGNDAAHVRMRFAAADGQWRWMLVASHAIRGPDGGPIGGISSLRDVHDEVIAEQRRTALLDSMLDPHLLLAPVRDGAGRVVSLIVDDANLVACRLLGTTHDQLIGSELSALVGGSAGQAMTELVVRVLDEGGPIVRDDREIALGPGGEPLWFDVRALGVGGHVSLTWRDVTERHRVADTLQASEARYRLLAENAADIVWVAGTDRKIRWISPSVERVLGWSPSELVGSVMADLMHPDDQQASRAYRDSVYAGVDLEESHLLRIRTARGPFRWLMGRAVPVLSETSEPLVLSSMRDVTDLVTSERHFRLLAENSSDVVVHLREGVVTWASPSIGTALGGSPDDWVGMVVAEGVHADDLRTLADAVGQIEAGRSVVRRGRVRSLGGGFRWIEAHAGPFLDEGGRPDGVVASFRVIDDEVAVEEQLQQQATIDSLTGLLNRAEISTRLASMLVHAPRSGDRIAVAFCDLDDFKTINDRFGHGSGDEALRVMSARIRAAVRDDDLVARIGGDELLVVLTGVHDLEGATAVAAKLCRLARIPVPVLGGTFTVTLSIGVTLAEAGEGAAEVLARADGAMYEAKSEGKDRVVAVEPAHGRDD
jgi:diguanylate cyclase (GGDEF)-like protein/PAS domain S-box-containing protein